MLEPGRSETALAFPKLRTFDPTIDNDKKSHLNVGMAKRSKLLSSCRLELQPDGAALAALEATFDARNRLLDWLDVTVPAGQSADLIQLNRAYYEPARTRFQLPSQMITLAFRDWTRRRRGEEVEGIALDDKLFSVRNVSTISISTIDGRYQVPFRTAGYLPGWADNASARLVRIGNSVEIRVASEVTILREERSMATEGIVGRIGRLIAGMAHGAVDSAEQANPKLVLEQAIWEIDSAADEVRVDLGAKTAERHRVESRRKELGGELADLDRTIGIAVKEGRDDLAAAGIERQMDIEAQISVLDALLRDIDESISQFNSTLDAVRASRREAEARLADLARSMAAGIVGPDGARHTENRVAAKLEKAEAAVARVTGVPGGLSPADPAVNDLRELAREHAIKERLARIKAGQ
ncbi:MAG: PspA/IM30 family protein [Methylobacterium sp.]|nr:PspA/IM30 family protein [Methylobacterium sp.]